MKPGKLYKLIRDCRFIGATRIPEQKDGSPSWEHESFRREKTLKQGIVAFCLDTFPWPLPKWADKNMDLTDFPPLMYVVFLADEKTYICTQSQWEYYMREIGDETRKSL